MGDAAPPPATPPGGAGPVSPLERLLEIQSHDTAIDQLRHRRANLAERARLRETEQKLSALDQRSKQAQTQRDELGARQGSIEQQIEASKSRKAELEKRMYGGQIAAPRELQAMDDEIKHLARHISELEDREIEIMESLEPLEGDLQAAETERDALERDASQLRAAISVSESELDSQISDLTREREDAAASLAPELLTRYEQLRKKLGGTGAARLVNGSCSGCHLALPAMEVDRIRRSPPDAIMTCDQCGRILVR
jgi:predicted  nucleic acid-binding Zn-ribbon protein